MAPDPPLCRSEYQSDTETPPRWHHSRIVRCGLLKDHDGDHDEMIDGEAGVVTWPQRDGPPPTRLVVCDTCGVQRQVRSDLVAAWTRLHILDCAELSRLRLQAGSGEVEIDQLREDVEHLRAERDRMRAERDQLAAAVKRYVKYWGASTEASPRRALHEVELLAAARAATPDAEPAATTFDTGAPHHAPLASPYRESAGVVVCIKCGENWPCPDAEPAPGGEQ